MAMRLAICRIPRQCRPVHRQRLVVTGQVLQRFGVGRAFERGELSFQDLVTLAARQGEPMQRSGQQERYEQLLTMYI